MNHTKGKWFHHAPSGYQHTAGGYISASDDRSADAICHVFGSGFDVDECRANARRIVDCVNACDGMENPADYIAKLLGERDELLRVMIEIKADCDEEVRHGGKVCIATDDVRRVIEMCGE